MQLLYSLLLTLAFIALLPYFVHQAFVNRKYFNNFRQRMGLLPDSLNANSRPTIWLHAVSVGETLAAGSLVKALRVRFPQHRLIISTTTATGQTVARARMAEADGFCFFPFDWRFCVRRALDTIQPQILILMESELWPNFLSECRQRDIPVLVANGRISDRSFVRSQKFGFFVRRLFRLVTRFAMQSQVDAERAIRLGAPPNRVSVSGNIKYDIGVTSESRGFAEVARSLAEVFALSSAPLVVAGSTSDGEEEIVLSAFKQIREEMGLEKTRLLIAPRHPERFGDVVRMLDSSRLKYVRRSTIEQERVAEAQAADCIFLDTVGELAALYRFASVVFIGGSLVPKGGHNILEPALYAKPIIVGPYMENFREITNDLLGRDALIQLRGESEEELISKLKTTLIELLTDQGRAQRLGENARRTIEDNSGATARTLALVVELIERNEEIKRQKAKGKRQK
ncbi:MAG: 3-deoxy-D-manno-octulosonic acid transferase [Acidobacteria bacterium]|nr:3-deoxy-D-manno-octulosonic acid transferase [Acidobacteriota bacterium]